jgi:polyhydroxybutyrate depolymerase
MRGFEQGWAAWSLTALFLLSSCQLRRERAEPRSSSTPRAAPAPSTHPGAPAPKDSILEHEGHARRFRVHVPPSAGREAVALIVLHGGGGSIEKIEEQTRLSRTAAERGFVLVYPNGNGTQWNDGRPEAAAGGDDVGFLTRLVGEMKKVASIDEKRVFLAGVSNGGMMTLRMACERTALFAGYAVISASMPKALAPLCKPSAPVSIVFVHAPEDPIMPWAGGEIKAGRRHGVGGEVIGLPRTIELWRTHNGCAETPSVQALPDRDPHDGTRVTRKTHVGCQGRLQLYQVDGGGHTWPGGTPGLIQRQVTGSSTRDVSGNDVLVEFFALGR